MKSSASLRSRTILKACFTGHRMPPISTQWVSTSLGVMPATRTSTPAASSENLRPFSKNSTE
ncbi:hypothetical protein ACU686_11995 [Yinghuangia aomiensis]